MGISNKYHFKWLTDSTRGVRNEIRNSLRGGAIVLGVGEQEPNPLIKDLMREISHTYKACDLYPKRPGVLRCDLNNLSPILDDVNADVVSIFRSSYFIDDKNKFFNQARKIVTPGGYLLIDFLIGSSQLPVLNFQYGYAYSRGNYDKNKPVYFKTSFFDDKLIDDFPLEAEMFISHARHWPVQTALKYFFDFPFLFFRHSRALRDLNTGNMLNTMRSLLSQKNLVSLQDFKNNGFEVLVYNAKYFYPLVKKFNLYNFVVARRVS